MKRDKTKEFIAKARVTHGDKYDYSETLFVNTRTEIIITCPHHGRFMMKPRAHLMTAGCRTCARYGEVSIQDYYLNAFHKTHGSVYDYSEVGDITSSATRVIINCKVHGSFSQTVSGHKAGKGCPSCGIERSRDAKIKGKTWFLEEARKHHATTYDYSLVEFHKLTERVSIICPVHGVFSQQASKHAAGAGCTQCATDKHKHTTESFITLSKQRHGERYGYDKVEYVDNKTEVLISCPLHGIFSQLATSHLEGKGCKSCISNVSSAERDIIGHLECLGLPVDKGNRKLLAPKELDLVIHENKIAIEYNGVYWHSEKRGKDKHYHKNKTDMCNEAGYRLIHIWEDDYLTNPEKELKFLAHALGVSDTKPVYARKTVLRELDGVVAKPFLDEHHIQGAVSSSVYLGHFHEDELVAVTTFTFKNKKAYAELTRHTTKSGVLGSLGKATKWFSKTYKINIISFCDLSRFDGKSYVAAGFEKIGVIAPDYKYVVGNKREHKFGWRKKSIQTKLPEIYDESLTEKQMMDLADIPRVWDCGKIKFEYKYKGESK